MSVLKNSPIIGQNHFVSSKKTYEGKRNNHPTVLVDGQPLDPQFDVWPFNYDGFDWGCGGSGDKQLALAILINHLNDAKLAFALCDQFNWNVIANLPLEYWTLTSAEIDNSLTLLNVESLR